MVKKYTRNRDTPGKEAGHQSNREDARDALSVSMLETKLEEQIKIIRGPLASHVTPEALEFMDQKRTVFDRLLEFIKTTKPRKQQLAEFVEQQKNLLQGKIGLATGREKEHLKWQLELYSKILVAPLFDIRGSDIFQ